MTLNYLGIIALPKNFYSNCYWYHIDCVKNKEALPHCLRSRGSDVIARLVQRRLKTKFVFIHDKLTDHDKNIFVQILVPGVNILFEKRNYSVVIINFSKDQKAYILNMLTNTTA